MHLTREWKINVGVPLDLLSQDLLTNSILYATLVESSDDEMSINEEVGESSGNKQNEDTGGDPFWILDLNPDM